MPLALLLWASPVAADTLEVDSCDVSAVQATLDGAAAGDEIVLPACSATWDTSLVVTLPVTIRGAGETSTLLEGGGAAFVDADIDEAGLLRVTGIGFHGSVDGEAISLNGRATFRFDHLRFEDISGRSIWLGYQNWATEDVPALRGLIDHVTFVSADSRTPIMVYGRDDAWLRGEVYGTDDFVFVEDSTFTWATPGVNSSVLDGEHGARFVVRHNRIVNGQIQQHDTGSTPQGRGTRAIEIYDNTFVCELGDCGNSIFGIRGGTGLIHDNALPTGFESVTFTQIYRVTDLGSAPWESRCDGTVEHVCSTFFSHCSGGDHHTCFSDSECGGAGSCVGECGGDGECPAGSTCVQLDGHEEASGWPCRDQTGRGADDPVTHAQASAPLYFWDNALPSGVAPLFVPGVNAAYIAEDRDYCNHDPSTACGAAGPFTYTPFPYPHPLATGEPIPDAGVDADVGARDGGPGSDGGVGVDGGSGPGTSGCACRAGRGPLPQWTVLVLALALALLRRR